MKTFEEFLTEIKSTFTIEDEYIHFMLNNPNAKAVVPEDIKVGDQYDYKGTMYTFMNSPKDIMRMTIQPNPRLQKQS